MRRAAVIASLVTCLAWALPTPAAADTSISEVGVTGRHVLTDTALTPGAWCGYVWGDEGMDLFLVRVEPPTVYAVDRTAARDHQGISWRVLISARPMFDSGKAKIVMTTRWYRARAWDDRPAILTRVIVPNTAIINEWARAYVEIRWHDPADPSVIMGRSRHRIDFNLVHPPYAEPHTIPRCTGWGMP